MKLVLEDSVAVKWYFHDADYMKASDLRWNFFQRIHELLAPDSFLTNCADAPIQAERKKIIAPGETTFSLKDLIAIGMQLHPSVPLLPRATEIAFATGLTVTSSLYIALAEPERMPIRHGISEGTPKHPQTLRFHPQFRVAPLKVMEPHP